MREFPAFGGPSYDWYGNEYYTGAGPGAQPWLHDVTQSIGSGISQLGQVFSAPSSVPHAVDKVSSASDAVEKQANQFGDDSRRTLAIAQASMTSASKQLEETSKHVQDTAQTVKYVVIGVGALAGVALLFSIIRSSSG